MRYLVDTNVLSELAKDTPEPRIAAWFSDKDADSIFISAITIGEVAYGIERKAEGKSKDKLRAWFTTVLVEWFSERIVAIDEDVMLTWAKMRSEGRTLPILDSLIAATAITAGATLVTRNTKDFKGTPNLHVLNPWGR
jgi:predicted nucleic acid-binding protein